MLRKRRGTWLAVVAVVVFVLPALAAAGPFDNLPYDKLPLDKIKGDKAPFFAYSELYVLGNSLSDVGNVFIASEGTIPPYPPYYNGRFTNGFNYTDYLAEDLMLLNDPSLLGGTNFAWGGARTSGGPVPSGLEQLAQYQALAAVYPPDADDLFVVFLGGNNMFDIIDEAGPIVLGGGDPTLIIETRIAQAMGDMAAILGGLIESGAVNIVVPNVPNMGLAPGVTLLYGGVFIDLATIASQSYNDALEDLLTDFDRYANIMRVDVYSFLSEVVDDPESFGLTEAVLPCLLVTMCDNPDYYLFWDLEHPTTVGHMLLADAVFDAVKKVLPAAVSK
jgi:outer membrane lipase/esterase